MDYTTQYIKKMLSSDEELDAPDQNKANGTYHPLMSLWGAHQAGGVLGAKRAWDTLVATYPQLQQYNLEDLLIHADDLRHLPSPTHIISDYPLYDGGFNVMFGPSGTGKSFLALEIAALIAVNSPVIYIAGEGLHGYSPRWEALKKHKQLPRAELYFYTEALQVMDDDELKRFIAAISEHNPGLVIIDTMARSAVGIDENSSKDVGMFVSKVDEIRHTIGCATLVVHHTGKSGHLRGSSALYAASDSVIAVSQDDGVIKCTNNPENEGKNKYGVADWTRRYRLLPIDEGAVLVDAGQIVDDPRIEVNLTDNQREVLDYLSTFRSSPQIAKTIVDGCGVSQPTVYRSLKKFVDYGFVSVDNDLYQITESGINALESGS